MEAKGKTECYNCHRIIPADARYCPFCGYDQVEKSGFMLKKQEASLKEMAIADSMATASQTATSSTVTQTQGSGWPHYREGMQEHQSDVWIYSTPRKNQRETNWADVAKLVGSIGALFFLIMLFLEVAFALGGLAYLPQMASFPYAYPFYFITPFVVGIYAIQGLGYAVIYVLFLIIAIVALSYVLKGSRNFFRELTLRDNRVEGSTLFLIASLLMAYLFFSLITVFIVEGLGETPSSPNFSSNPVYMNYFLFVFAPVWEEIAVRVLLLGLPLMLIAMLTHKKDRPAWKYLLGGNLRLGPAAVFFLIISSVMFGLGHWLAGSGWGFWKIFPASVAGLFLGYLFLKKGLFAAIIFHFGVDAEELLVLSNFPAVATLTGIFVIVWAILGLMFFIYYFLVMVGFISSRSVLPEKVRLRYSTHVGAGSAPSVAAPAAELKPFGETAQEQNNGSPASHVKLGRDETSFGFVCSYCGSTEARYKDGSFICMHCGKEMKK